MNAKMHNKEMSRCYLFCDSHILSELYRLGIKITLAIVYALVLCGNKENKSDVG